MCISAMTTRRCHYFDEHNGDDYDDGDGPQAKASIRRDGCIYKVAYSILNQNNNKTTIKYTI